MRYVFLILGAGPSSPTVSELHLDLRIAPGWMGTAVAVGAGSVDVSGARLEGADGVVQVCVVEASDLDHAIRVASRWPPGATIDIRPVASEDHR
jgi:hypothetical protein